MFNRKKISWLVLSLVLLTLGLVQCKPFQDEAGLDPEVNMNIVRDQYNK